MPVTSEKHKKIFPFDPRKSLLEIRHDESAKLASRDSYWNSIKVTLYRKDFSEFGYAFMKFFKLMGKLTGEIRIGRPPANSSLFKGPDYFCYDYREEISVFPEPAVFNFKSSHPIVVYKKGNDTAVPVQFIKGILTGLSCALVSSLQNFITSTRVQYPPLNSVVRPFFANQSPTS